MPTDMEQLPKGKRHKYSYYNATGVYAPNGRFLGVCFGYKTGDHRKEKPTHLSFVLVPVMSETNTEKWLERLQKAVDFKYEWVDNFKEDNPYKRLPCQNETKRAVRIWYPEPANYAHCVLFGNLCKGISEHAWFCEKHLEDKTNGIGFFTKNFRAFKQMAQGTIPYASYSDPWPTGHSWWQMLDIPKDESSFKTKSIRRLLERVLEIKPSAGNIWNTCLDR